MINKKAFHLLQPYRKQCFYLLLVAMIGTFGIVGQAWSFATIIDGAFLGHQSLESLYPWLGALCGAILVRMLFTYAQERLSHALGGGIKEDLRQAIVDTAFRRHLWGTSNHGDVVHLLTDGLEQVDAYVARYVPQLIYALLIPLVMGIAIVKSAPWISLILLITFPLIPFFMILIGKKAESMNQVQWERMSYLSGHFLDVLQGMTTLKVFGRAKEQIDVIARLSGEFRDATLRVLRVAFLSALVLELISTISTALIAVYLGLALLYGEIEFFPAFFVLLLAPDFYAPLRQLGTAFHTGMAGNVSIEKIDAFLSAYVPPSPSGSELLNGPMERILCDNVFYSYEEDSKTYAIEGISLTLQQDEPVMVVGQSGAGKSTLSYILLGLMNPTKGRVVVQNRDLADLNPMWWREQIAYIPQRPYIFTGTIGENIRFGAQCTQEEVIQAAQQAEAHEFIMTLPDGYDTVLQENGKGLSGGQKQRIALARAFLKDASILILDEATAHLDVETEAALHGALERLMRGKIALLIGHRLPTMNLAKKIVVMKEGHIVEEGAVQELLGKQGYFYELVKEGLGSVEVVTNALEYTYIHKEDCAEGVGRRALENLQPPVYHDEVASISTRAALSQLMSVLRRARLSLWGSIAFSFITVFMNVGLLATSAWLISTAALHPELVALSLAIVGVRFFGISRAVSRYAERYISHHMAFQGLYALRVWLYTKLEPLAPAMLQKWGTGDLLGRMMADIETLQFFYLRVIIPPVAALALTGIGIFFYSHFSWTFVELFLVLAILGGCVVPWYVHRGTDVLLRDSLACRSEGKRELVEVLDGMLDIISYNQQHRVKGDLHRHFSAYDHYTWRISGVLNRGESAFLGVSLWTLPLAVVCAYPLLQGGVPGVYLAVLAISLQAYFECLQPMMNVALHGKESMYAMKRLAALVQDEPPYGKATEASISVSASDPAVVLENVQFSYGDRPVYEGLSFTVAQGERVAIVGPSGSGKSTLFALLGGFYEAKGSIRVQGQLLGAMDMEQWREQFSVITQDTHIFHATLGDNLRLANPKVSSDQIEEIVHRVELGPWVASLPQGLHTMVGSGGMGMSGGQRQRVALGRLLLRESPILLLDEPLEALDQVTRQRIWAHLLEAMKGRTALYITHHILGLEAMDRIVFMEDGRIVEDGNFHQLLEKRGRFYEYYCLSMSRLS